MYLGIHRIRISDNANKMSSDNIGTYEEYLFAKDKKEFLESCKNSSELKQYIRLCHLLNHPEIVLE